MDSRRIQLYTVCPLDFTKAFWIVIGYSRDSFCSFPAQACVQHTTTSVRYFNQTYVFGAVDGNQNPAVTCVDNSTLRLIGSVGMAYELLAKVKTVGGTVECSALSSSNASVLVSNASSAWIIWVGGTNYNIDAGNAAYNFSFAAAEGQPYKSLSSLLLAASEMPYDSLLSGHQTDYVNVLTSN